MVARMDWKASRPAIEIAAEWIAATCLGGAVGFAAAQFGAGLALAGAAGALIAVAGLIVLGRVDRAIDPRAEGFAPVGFGEVEEDVSLLDQPIGSDDALLLDDPLPALDQESRVVRLFAAQSPRSRRAVAGQSPGSDEAAPPLAGPGEMVARIEDFLELGRGGAAVAEGEARAASIDASAALHAALADIRRSLRQG